MSIKNKRIPLKPHGVLLSSLDLSNASPSPLFHNRTTQNHTSKHEPKFDQMKSFFKLGRSIVEARSSPRSSQPSVPQKSHHRKKSNNVAVVAEDVGQFADDVLQTRRTYHLEVNTEITEPYAVIDPRYQKLQASASASKLSQFSGNISASKVNVSKVILSPLRDPRISVKGANFEKLFNYTRDIHEMSEALGPEPHKKKAKLCQNFLTLLSKEEGKYRNEIVLLNSEIRNSIFCSSPDLIDEINFLAPNLIKQGSSMAIAYFDIVKKLMRYIELYQAEVEEQRFEDRRTIAELKEKIDKFKQVSLARNLELLNTGEGQEIATETTDPDLETKKLVAKENGERVQETPLLHQNDQVKTEQQVEQETQQNFERKSMKSATLNMISNINASYEQTIIELTSTVDSLKVEKERLQREFSNLKSTIRDIEETSDQNAADEYIEHIKLIAKQKLDMEGKLDKSKAEMEKLKENYLKLIESYRNSIIKLKFTKEQSNKMEEQVKELSAENAKLSVRAAVGLSNLTPRPSVDPVLDFFGLAAKKADGTAEKLELVNKFISENKPRVTTEAKDVK